MRRGVRPPNSSTLDRLVHVSEGPGDPTQPPTTLTDLLEAFLPGPRRFESCIFVKSSNFLSRKSGFRREKDVLVDGYGCSCLLLAARLLAPRIYHEKPLPEEKGEKGIEALAVVYAARKPSRHLITPGAPF